MISNKEIIDTLLAIAKDKGYSIGKFEKSIGVRIGYFSRVKRANGDIAFRIFRESAKILGIDNLSDLFNLIEQSKEKYEYDNKCQEVIRDFGEITSKNVKDFVKVLKDNGIVRSDKE